VEGLGQINFVTITVVSLLLGLLPIAVVTMTSFGKIAIVLSIVRNALGIQQTPPNLLLNSIALILSAYIMAPVGKDIYNSVSDPRNNFQTISGWERVVDEGTKPLKQFLMQHSDPQHRIFFAETTQKIWKNKITTASTENDLHVLVPAFLVSELTRAFEIAFLLYMPFLMIDLIVSAILVAMGMSMMSPPVVSTPLKLLLFVLVDGWSRLLEGLVLSYAS
jgi:type III secretion protein R